MALPETGGGSATGGTGVVPLVALPIRNNLNTNLNISLSDASSPAREREAVAGIEKAAGGRDAERAGRMAELWDGFAKAWPWTAVMSPSEARTEFERLSLPDAKKAAEGAALYAAATAGLRSASARKDAGRWLRARDFEVVALVAATRPAAEGGKSVFVIRGTDAWQAWCAHRAASGVKPPPAQTSTSHPGKTGWWFATLFPPGVGDLASGSDPPDRSYADRRSG